MRLASVDDVEGGGVRLAAVLGDGDLDALRVALLPEHFGRLDDVVRAGPQTLDALRAAVGDCPVRPAADVTFLAPLHRFNRDILCTGWNYTDHFEESLGKRDGQGPDTLPSHPTFFGKAPGTVVGPFDDIAYDPRLSQQWDYEAELAMIIGRDGRSIPEGRAMEHVFGFCVANDVSQRDLQRAHGGQWLKGKSIDATMPLGPWVTTADEVSDPYALTIECDVNGERMQQAVTGQVAFSFATLIAELSWGMTLHAGDVILTGTPSGVGNAREPQVFLTDGDLVVTRVSGLGELRNRVRLTTLT